IARNTGARLYALRTNVDQAFLNGKVKVTSGLNITRNSLNRGLSNNDNTNTSPIYGFAYTPGVINLDSVDATGTYVRNPFNGGGNGVSNPFETFRYLRLNELTFRQIGNLNASWSALSAAQHQVSVTATGGFDRVQISGDLFSRPFLEYEGSDGFFGRTVRSEVNIFNYSLAPVPRPRRAGQRSQAPGRVGPHRQSAPLWGQRRASRRGNHDRWYRDPRPSGDLGRLSHQARDPH